MLLSDRILTPGQVGSGTVYHNTSAGNVDGTLPVTPNEGTQIRVVNIGTGDNKVINLPDSIELGNGKSIIFVYHDTVWYYEDVIIDEYESGGQAVKKWSGGSMVIVAVEYIGVAASAGTATGSLYTSAASMDINFPESFVSDPCVTVANTPSSNLVQFGIILLGATTTKFVWRPLSSASTPSVTWQVGFHATGRWKL